MTPKRRRSSWDEQPDMFADALRIEQRKRLGEMDPTSLRYEALKAPLAHSAKTSREYEHGIRKIVKRIRY